MHNALREGDVDAGRVEASKGFSVDLVAMALSPSERTLTSGAGRMRGWARATSCKISVARPRSLPYRYPDLHLDPRMLLRQHVVDNDLPAEDVVQDHQDLVVAGTDDRLVKIDLHHAPQAVARLNAGADNYVIKPLDGDALAHSKRKPPALDETGGFRMLGTAL